MYDETNFLDSIKEVLNMPDIKEKLIEGLFETDAIKVCPAGKPFWYTSGKIGPYYVNTHFRC